MEGYRSSFLGESDKCVNSMLLWGCSHSYVTPTVHDQSNLPDKRQSRPQSGMLFNHYCAFTQAAIFGCGCWADQSPGVPSNAVACSTSGESHVTLIFLFEFHTLYTHSRYR